VRPLTCGDGDGGTPQSDQIVQKAGSPVCVRSAGASPRAGGVTAASKALRKPSSSFASPSLRFKSGEVESGMPIPSSTSALRRG